jgi:hypothetical protein
MAVFEALKIDHLSDKRRVHRWFLILFALASAVYLTEYDTQAIFDFQQKIMRFTVTQTAFPFPPNAWVIALLKETGLFIIALFFMLLYALHWLTEPMRPLKEDTLADDQVIFRRNPLIIDLPLFTLKENVSPLRAATRAFPSLLLIVASTLIIYVLSLPLYRVPFYIVASTFSMSVFVLIFDEKNIPSSLESSAALTGGMKFAIFVSFFFLRSVLNFGENVLLLIMGSKATVDGLIRAFFFALKTLSFGRMAGITFRLAYYKESPAFQDRMDEQ